MVVRTPPAGQGPTPGFAVNTRSTISE
jgi:hypothetical protein